MTGLSTTAGDLSSDVPTRILRRTGSDITADDVVETSRRVRRERHLPANPGVMP